MNIKKYVIFFIGFSFFSFNALALPIDWTGTFGVDSTLIDNFRKIEQINQNTSGNDTQEVTLAAGEQSNASFQTYLVSLQPNIIVNDSASLVGEVTTGYGRGGRLGDDSARRKDGEFANALYYHNTSAYNNALNFTQLYMELYSDTATYLIGRHTSHWGLGAVFDNGKDSWDRHVSIRDGLTLKIQLGNFKIEPFIGKIGSAGSLSRATKVQEQGVSILYDNKENDLTLGALYSIKKNNSFNQTLTADIDGSGPEPIGKTDVKLIDIFLKRKWTKFDLSLEIPLFSGEIGDVYQNGGNAKYKAKAFLFESNYYFNDSWKLSLNAGHISGDNGNRTSFEAAYLHPNYQIANLMFRYNLNAVADTDQNVFDSYLTNVKFLKVSGEYKSEKTTLSTALIYAIANETAKSATTSFNHERNKIFSAVADQSDSYGLELDANYDYHWSSEVTLGLSFGYQFTGDYYGFNNTADKNSADNSYILQFRSLMTF